MAGPVLSSTIKILDQASGPMRRITSSGEMLNNMMNRSNQIAQKGIQQTRGAINQAQSYNGHLNKTATGTNKVNENLREMHITLFGMLRVMAYFAINLQIINALMSPFSFMKGAINAAGMFQDKMGQVNALLRLSRKELSEFGIEVRRIATFYGTGIDKTLDASKEIASSISSFKLGNLTEQEGVIKILRASARGAVIDNVELIDSVGAVRTMLAAMNIEVNKADRVFDLLFATVDVGNLSFKTLEQDIGTFLGTFNSLVGTLPDARKFGLLEEMMAMFGSLSNWLPSSEAATGVNRILLTLLKQGEGQKDFIQQFQKKFDVDLSAAAFTSKGPMQWFQDFAKVVRADSPMLDKIVKQYVDLEKIPKDAPVADYFGQVSSQMITSIFDNIRAARPAAQMVIAADEVSKLHIDLLDSIDKVDRAFDEAYYTFERQKSRMSSLADSFRVSIGLPIVEEASLFFGRMVNSLDKTVNNAEFDKLPASEKFSKVLDNVNLEFGMWWNYGGQEKAQGFANEFIESLLVVLNQGVASNADKFVEIGETIVKSVISGFVNGFKDNPGSMLGSSFLHAGVLSKTTGMPYLHSLGIASVGKSLAGNAGSGDSFGSLINLGMLGMLGFGGLRSRGGQKPPGFMGTGGWRGAAMSGAGIGVGGMMYGDRSFQARGGNIVDTGTGRIAANWRSSAIPYIGLSGAFADTRSAPKNMRTGVAGKHARAALTAGRARVGGFTRSPIVRTGAALLAMEAVLGGIGPFSDQGGLFGMLNSNSSESGRARYRQQQLSGSNNIGDMINRWGSDYRPGRDVGGNVVTMAMLGGGIGLLGGGIGAGIGVGVGAGIGISQAATRLAIGGRNPTGGDMAKAIFGASAGAAAAGAGIGAGIGSIFGGLGAIPGALIGGAIGAGAGAIGGFIGIQQSRREANDRIESLKQEEKILAAALEINAPYGFIGSVIDTAKEEGLAGQKLNSTFIAAMAMGNMRTGFKDEVVHSPTRDDPYARQFGVLGVTPKGVTGDRIRQMSLEDSTALGVRNLINVQQNLASKGIDSTSDNYWQHVWAQNNLGVGYNSAAFIPVNDVARGNIEKADEFAALASGYENRLRDKELFQEYQNVSGSVQNNLEVNVAGDLVFDVSGGENVPEVMKLFEDASLETSGRE